MNDQRPVTATIRVVNRNAAHVTLAVFVGRQEGSRGHAGTLTLRTDEYDQLGHVDTDGNWVVRFSGTPNAEDSSQ